MSAYRVEQTYDASIESVWRALTDPELIPKWTSTGKGGVPVGFAPIAGTRFQYVAKPMPGWKGIVECEVREVSAPTLLRYSWQGDDGDDVTEVTCRLQSDDGRTRLVWDHTGFTGIGGFFVCKILERVRRTMLAKGLREALRDQGSR